MAHPQKLPKGKCLVGLVGLVDSNGVKDVQVGNEREDHSLKFSIDLKT